MNIVFARSSNIYDDSRATKEITAFLDKGYSVKVLGWNRAGNAVEKCKELFNNYSNINFFFYNGKVGSSIIQKISGRIKWNIWLRGILSSFTEIDIIHACDFDTGVAVEKFAISNNIKYVYDIFDYYVDAHPVPGLVKHIIENQEIRVINNADLTIICTEERKEQIIQSNPKRLLVIHNSPDVGASENSQEEYDYAYCGTMSGGRLICEILDAYPEHNQMRFLFAGFGSNSEKARRMDSEYERFEYVGSITYSQVLEYEGKSKVISAIYNPNVRNHRLCAPNKFYEALALGKPIIVCKGTGIDQIVQDNRIGCVINYNAEEFYKALEYLLHNDDLRKQMGVRGRKIYEKKYKWSLMREKLLDEYSLLLDNGETGK